MIELLKLGLGNLIKRKKRTALTLVGLFIGIAAVVALISLGQGLQQTINAQFEKVGADKIFVQAKDIGNFGGIESPGKLTEREQKMIQKVHGVAQTAGEIFVAANVQYNKLQRTLYVISVPEKQKEAQLVIKTNIWEVSEGRMLTHTDKGKAVIGYNLGNKKLFGRNIAKGDKISVNGVMVSVVGVIARTGDPGTDSSVILPEADARAAVKNPDTYSMILAQSIQSENPDTVAKNIEKALRRDRHQKEGKEDFMVQTSTELIKSFNVVLNVVQAVFVGIALISLLVGGIGIMNTMFTSVLDRTREIGVMKAIGARNKDILGIFLFESGVLGGVGGLVGIIVGAGISKGVEFGANTAFGPGTISTVFPWYLIVGVLLFSVVVGIISGIFPAHRASKLQPVDALREE
ncbi:MAG: ABC transporter permease [Candidatus Woesearchaeota archaeon]|nr:ABC transporter permease [Candidatus Woesearchaeota archaeon]